MIRNILRHIVKLVAIKQSLLMDVISKPESRFNHECRNSANVALFIGEMIKRENNRCFRTSAVVPLHLALRFYHTLLQNVRSSGVSILVYFYH